MYPLTSIPHGGALAAAARKFGGSKADWLDLSTGINPVPAPLPEFAPHIWQALPDTDVLAECLSAARAFYGLQPAASIVAAPGVQALIQLLPRLKPEANVAILGPTYGEYAHVFQGLGHTTRIITSVEALGDEPILVIVNPNNPDGRVVLPDDILAMARSRAKLGGFVIVDEAFADLTPEISVGSSAGIEGLLLLKSFGKYFGLAGVRLGFAVGHTNDISKLEMLLGPWAVSGPALMAGTYCYGFDALRSEIEYSITENAQAQRQILTDAGLKIIADTGLFQLVETINAAALYDGLAKQHILTRIFEFNANWLRFGLCANAGQRQRLTGALQTNAAGP